MIDKLTSEQEKLIPVYLKKYYDKVYKWYKINKNMAELSIKYIYKNAGYSEPYIWYCQSPLQAQLVINILKNIDSNNNLRNNLWNNLENNLWNNLKNNLGNNLGNNLLNNLLNNLRNNLWNNLENNLKNNLLNNLENNLWNNLGNNLGNNLWNNLKNNLGNNLGNNLWNNLKNNLWNNLKNNLENNLRNNLKNNLWNNLKNNLRFELFSYFGNISDYGWTCFYDFVNNELIPSYNLELWTKWKELINSNIYDMIQMEELCIVIQMPIKININEQYQLHNENNYAVEFEDGYSICAWNGLIIDESWIFQKDKITKQTIINEKNAEKRRCLKEILGTEKYAKLLEIKIIDQDIDQYNYPIKLWKSKEKDEIIEKHYYFLDVICPSTQRQYFIGVPECRNVWEAKAWGFENKKIKYRHGDIGFLDLKKEFNQPICET